MGAPLTSWARLGSPFSNPRAGQISGVFVLRLWRPQPKSRLVWGLVAASGYAGRDLMRLTRTTNRMSVAEATHGCRLRVIHGADAGLESVPLSLVAAPCRALDQQLVGTLGVLGPTRMNYSRVIPLVSCLAALAGQRFAPASSNFATNQEEN